MPADDRKYHRSDSSLGDIEVWRRRLGLYPVPLFTDEVRGDQFVLLNGSRGNFCLDLSSKGAGPEPRNSAWSSDVGHYVTLAGECVEVQRWDRRSRTVERFAYRGVAQDLEGFHAHLERDQPRRELSVVSHVVRVFRSLRSALGVRIDGSDSLKAFLYLLACVTDCVERDKLSLNRWRLDHRAAEIASDVSEGEWLALVDELVLGRRLDELRPDANLLLRHASGQVFQEAHYEATAIGQTQMMLKGFAPTPVALEKGTKATGLHFTPPALARTLVEESIVALGDLPRSLVIFDPACGSGEFLKEAARQLKLIGYSGRIKLIGWDISPAACDMASFILAWETRGRAKQISAEVRCIDSITERDWPQVVNLAVMNPPFVSWLDMTGEQKSAVTSVLGPLSKIRPDLASAFILRAASSLSKGGVLASILPASFLDGDSAARVRTRLGETLSTKLVARLGSHQLFYSATVDAALYVGSVDRNNPEPAVAFWADHRPHSTSAGLRSLRKARYLGSAGIYPILETGFNIYTNPDIGRGGNNWAPRPFEAWRTLNSLVDLPRVKALFDVKQGALTGLNRVFLLSRQSWQSLPTKRERAYFRPAVINESIRGGMLRDSAYVFYPYGEHTIETESELRSVVSSYYRDFLLPNKRALSARGSRRKAKWWELSEHRAWQEGHTRKLVTTYFGDEGSFACDSDGVYVVVQGYGWLFKKTGALTELPENVGLAYVAVLNSKLFSKLLSATSNHVGGGQWNLSKRFVDQIPVPNLLSGHVDPSVLSELSVLGAKMQAGSATDPVQLEELTNAVYGLGETL